MAAILAFEARCAISSRPSHVLAPLLAVFTTAWVEQDYHLSDCLNIRNHFSCPQVTVFGVSVTPHPLNLHSYRDAQKGPSSKAAGGPFATTQGILFQHPPIEHGRGCVLLLSLPVPPQF
jgi:hypothetical protein